MQTTIMFKTDKKLKEAVQKTAKTMGIPLSAVMNQYMRNFVDDQNISFSSEKYNPTPYLRKILDQGEKDLAAGKNIKTFDNLEDLFADLNA